ncbi:MAG: hypothetical protein QHH00_01290 [Methanomassiliicoccales archaeon]|nr:hypothetical protein [Methanomassiliicoccales archaeon]
MTENPPIAPEILAKVIASKVGVNGQMAKELALRILNYFGYGEVVIDNILDQEDRRLFYFLQDLKLLKTNWEETILPNGRSWRIFYWELNIEEILHEARKLTATKDEIVNIYDTLPDTVWSRERPEVAV